MVFLSIHCLFIRKVVFNTGYFFSINISRYYPTHCMLNTVLCAELYFLCLV